ncbi:MAG: P-type conjugative transfer protein TrbG [Sphingomonas sp.]
MTRFPIFVLGSMASLSACAAGLGAATPTGAPFIAARLVADTPRAAKPIPHVPFLGEPRPLVTVKAHKGSSALSRVEAANRAAVHEPAMADYRGASQVYPWNEGAIYRLYTAPGEISDIVLEAGEGLVSVAAGDTARWIIGDTASGTGGSRRSHILVKPTAPGLKTNLVIATDRRVYHVELASSAGAAMASISWSYADEDLLALRGGPRPASQAVAEGVAVDALNFNYRIEGDNPSWRPVRAFDDGQQVFIEFPPSVSDDEAPPLFVTGEGGRQELVNYRVRGRYYLVDRLFRAAELRLGERRQQVVRIVRLAEQGKPRRGS